MVEQPDTWDAIREPFQTAASAVTALATIGGSMYAALKWLPPIWRWLLKRKRLRDKAWPIRLTSRNVDWVWLSTMPFIRVLVTFVMEVRETPLEVQAVQLRYTGDWFDGVQIANETGATQTGAPQPSLVGRRLTDKIQVAPYTAVFELVAPENKDAVQLKSTLVVEALGLPCEENLAGFLVKR